MTNQHPMPIARSIGALSSFNKVQRKGLRSTNLAFQEAGWCSPSLSPAPQVASALEVQIEVAIGECDEIAVTEPLRIIENRDDF